MWLTPVCDPFLIVYCLYRLTDSSKMHTQVSCFHPLRLAFLFFFLFLFFPFFFFFFLLLLLIDHFFHFKIFGRWIFVTNIKKMPDKWPQEKSTLSPVCTSKQLFLLVTKKKKSYQVPSNLARKPCEESNGTAQMHPGRRYAIRDCSITFSISPACRKRVLITVTHARKGNAIRRRGGKPFERKTNYRYYQFTMLHCGAFSCQKYIWNRHILKIKLYCQDFSGKSKQQIKISVSKEVPNIFS